MSAEVCPKNSLSAIIVMPAAVAIPQFAAYRKRSFIADVKSNLRNVTVAEEVYFVDNNIYKSRSLGNQVPPGYKKSTNVTVTATTAADHITLVGTDTRCPNAASKWTYKSAGGTIQDPAVGCAD